MVKKVLTDFDPPYITFDYLQSDVKFSHKSLFTKFLRAILASLSWTSEAPEHEQNAAFVMPFKTY